VDAGTTSGTWRTVQLLQLEDVAGPWFARQLTSRPILVRWSEDPPRLIAWGDPGYAALV
jgi:hypothetical protein